MSIHVPLTPREQEIAALYVTRVPEKKIANILRISPRTVEQHTRHIREKAAVTSREELIEQWGGEAA